MPEWRLETGPVSMPPSALLRQASARRLDVQLAQPSSLSFSLPGRHPDALQVTELATDVRLRRDQDFVFDGRVLSADDAVTVDEHRVAVTATDLRGVLGHRLVPFRRSYVNGDPGKVFNDVMIHAQAGKNGGLNMIVPPETAVGTVVRAKVTEGASILAALQDVAGSQRNSTDAAFDWDIVTDRSGQRTARIWAKRGKFAAADTLLYIDGQASSSISAFTREVDTSKYANTLIMSGGVNVTSSTISPATVAELRTSAKAAVARKAPGATGEPALRLGFTKGSNDLETRGEAIYVDGVRVEMPPRSYSSVDRTDSAGTVVTIRTPTQPAVLADGSTIWDIGPWAASEADDQIGGQGELRAAATKRIESMQDVQPAYTVSLSAGYWRGPGHLWVGDRVRMLLRSGRIQEDVTLRILAMSIDIGESGEESVSLSVGEAPATAMRELLDTNAKLTRLRQQLGRP